MEQLKASIEEREWIPAGLQRLVCGATPLTTGLLSEMGVGEEDTISLLMDIRVRIYFLLWGPTDGPTDHLPYTDLDSLISIPPNTHRAGCAPSGARSACAASAASAARCACAPGKSTTHTTRLCVGPPLAPPPFPPSTGHRPVSGGRGWGVEVGERELVG